jgi:hypothetical protein
LTTGISLTQFRIYGGEFTGDNTGLLLLDAGDTMAGGADFFVFGTYFANSGNNLAAVEVRGKWDNVILDGSRDEETSLPPLPLQVRGFVNLVDDGNPGNNTYKGKGFVTQLSSFRIHAYSDGDELGEVIRGTGNLVAGTITSSGNGGNHNPTAL